MVVQSDAPGRVARMLRLGVALIVLAGAGWLPAAVGAEPQQDATEMVRETSDAVLELIERARGYAKQDPERFYREVEALLSPVVDFQSFARSVMAVHFRKATPQQQERFAETFKWGLVRTYALALTDFEDGKVVVVPPDRPPRNPDRQTVKMEIHTKTGEVYPVLYSVALDDSGEWKVRNLIVNGVNMGLTYRNQFASAMNDPKYGGDLDKVIDAWGGLVREQAPLIDEKTGPAAPGAAPDEAGQDAADPEQDARAGAS
ncbi:MAG TPA: ABC transporter substrate-binding protein [Pseudomonadales bacterium]